MIKFPVSTVCLVLALLPFASGDLMAQAVRPSSAATGFSNRSTTGSSSATRGTGSSISSGAGTTRDYRNATMLGDALIQIDPETRSLVVVADEDTHSEILRVIKNLDQPKPQVLIKVLFAQVTLDKNIDFGIEGSYSFNAGPGSLGPLSALTSAATSTAASLLSSTLGQTVVTSTTTSGNTSTVTTTTSPIRTGGRGQAQTNFGLAGQSNGAFFQLNSANVTATLYALAQRGNVNILSRPSILARNNQEAVIIVGQEVPLVTSSQITTLGATVNSITYQDVGIILRVTPFITSRHAVEMIVSPEISSLSSQTVQVSPGVNAPVINKTSAETVVVTPDATTVVIGGMMQKQETSSISKVPLLGDIPILGNAFKHTVKGTTKTELLIFLTPYIVEGTDKLENLSLQETNRTDLPQQVFSGDDLNRYLDTLKLRPDDADDKDTVPVRRATPVKKQL